MLGLRNPHPQVSKALALPAPTGGINDLDPIAAMQPQFLIDTMNFFPDTNTLQVRNGYQEWVTGLVKPVKNIKTFLSYEYEAKLSQLSVAICVY